MTDAKFKPLPSRREMVDAAVSLLLLHGHDLVPAPVGEYKTYAVDHQEKVQQQFALEDGCTSVLALPALATEDRRKYVMLVRYFCKTELMPKTIQEIVKGFDVEGCSYAMIGSVYGDEDPIIPVPAVFVVPPLKDIKTTPIADLAWSGISKTTKLAVSNMLLAKLTEIVE